MTDLDRLENPDNFDKDVKDLIYFIASIASTWAEDPKKKPVADKYLRTIKRLAKEASTPWYSLGAS